MVNASRMILVCALLASCKPSPTPPLAGDAAVGDAGVGDAATPGADAGAADAGDVRPDATPAEARFIWPVNGWIVSTDVYETGETHTGSADIATPYHTPVGAARAGTVVRAELTEIGGYLVEIDHGDGYTTLYSHLAEPPFVAPGDTVATNDIIGLVGRTGRALRNGVHLHLAIRRDGQRLSIPDIDFGIWVNRGDVVAGEYDLPLVPTGSSEYLVDVAVTVPVRNAPDEAAPQVGVLEAGAVATVSGSDGGHLRVAAGPLAGWVVQSATAPAGSPVMGLQVVGGSAVVRSSPSASAAQVATFDDGALVTAFEESSGWYRVLYGLPTRYGWITAGDVEPTLEFEARLRAPSADVRSGPAATFDLLGTLQMYDRFVVHENREGWYRIDFDGGTAWVPGWRTQGRL